MPSKAHATLTTALGHATNLLGGTKTGRGKPSQTEVSMFVASVVLTYGAWEGYVEDVAVEANKFFATNATAAMVPTEARKDIESANPTAWELTLDPGWQELWQRRVTEFAKGSPNAGRPFGINTADVKNVSNLFRRVGLDPWIPLSSTDKEGIAQLVAERGTIAHTGSTPPGFNKAAAQTHLALVVKIVDLIDDSLAEQLKKITGQRPW